MELNDVLKEEPKTETQEAAVEAEAPPKEEKDPNHDYSSRKKALQEKEWAAQGRDPKTGQYVKKDEPKEEVKTEVKAEVKAEVKTEPQKEQFTEKERAFLKGLEEERRKRQELERQIAELRAPKQTEAEKKTFWDDPEGHFKSFEQRMAQREQNLTLQVSERIARSKYQDFDDAVNEFGESLKTTPGLFAEWKASPDPAEFAYRHGKRVKELKEVGSIEEYKKKVEQEIKAKLEAEYRAKLEEKEKLKTELPGTLSSVKGSATRQGPVYTGPTPLGDVLSG